MHEVYAAPLFFGPLQDRGLLQATSNTGSTSRISKLTLERVEPRQCRSFSRIASSVHFVIIT